MATVAMAALIGGTSVALAQQEEHGGGAAAPGAAQHQTAPGGAGGAMQHGQAPGAGTQTQMKPQGGATNEQKSVQGGAEEHGNTPMQRGAQGEPGKAGEPGKGGMNAQDHAQTPGGKGDQNAQTQDRSKENAQTQERGKTEENAQGTQERGAASQQNAQGRASGGKSVQLNETQRTQIKGIVVKDRNVTRVDHVDFSVNVGVAVPRTINVAVLPADIVEVVPEYRGFEYVVVGDQLLIIDPNTMLIVDILPV
jgi:hypothetical protein